MSRACSSLYLGLLTQSSLWPPPISESHDYIIWYVVDICSSFSNCLLLILFWIHWLIHKKIVWTQQSPWRLSSHILFLVAAFTYSLYVYSRNYFKEWISRYIVKDGMPFLLIANWVNFHFSYCSRYLYSNYVQCIVLI